MFSHHNNLRFFSNASLFSQQCMDAKEIQDPTPFGLKYQENFPKSDSPTLKPSPTNTPHNSDSGIDLDFNLY